MADTNIPVRSVCLTILLSAIVIGLAFLVRTHHVWADGLEVAGSYRGWSEFVQDRFVLTGRDIEADEFSTANYSSGIYRSSDDFSREEYYALVYTVLGIDTAEERQLFNNYGLIFGVLIFPITMVAVYVGLTKGRRAERWLLGIFILYLSLFATSSLVNFTDAGNHHQILAWIYLANVFICLLRLSYDWRYAFLHILFSLAIPLTYRTSAMFYLSIAVGLSIVWLAALVQRKAAARSADSLQERLDLIPALTSGVIVLSVFMYLSVGFFSQFSDLLASFPEFLTGAILASRYDQVESYLLTFPTWVFRLNLLAWLLSVAPVIALLFSAYWRKRAGKPLLRVEKVVIAYILGVAILSLGLSQWAGLSGVYARTTEALSLVVILSFVAVAATCESRRVVYAAAIFALIGSGLGLVSYLTAFDASYKEQLTAAEGRATTFVYDATSWSESGFYTDLRIGGALVGKGALYVAGPEDTKPRKAVYELNNVFYEASPPTAYQIMGEALPVKNRYLLLSRRMTNTRVGFQSGDFTYKALPSTLWDAYAASPLFDQVYDNGVSTAFRLK